MRNFPSIITQIIEKSGFNINQISKISGVSNTYLNKLIKNNINHPGKDKIASILIALNYTITHINQILAQYDYMPLNEYDIPEILKNNRRRKMDGKITPHFDHIYFELAMAALENIGGTKIIIKHRPSGIFIPMELYMMKEFPKETDNKADDFYKKFTANLVNERKALFLKNHMAGHRFETYICKKCLEENFERNFSRETQSKYPLQIEYGIKYFANAVSASLKYPQQHVHAITKRCAYFQFQMQNAEGEYPNISFTTERRHIYSGNLDQMMLEGFLSNDPLMLDIFYNEIENCRNAVDKENALETAEGFHEYIRALFNKYGFQNKFDAALSGLMTTQNFILY